MVVSGHIKRRCNDLALDGALHVRDLFRALVNQQADEVHFRVVDRDGLADLLEDRGLARLGRRDDQAALALADGAHDVDRATGDGVLAVLHPERLVGVHGREVGELGAVLDLLGIQAVDRAELGKPGKLVVRAHGAKRAGDQVAGAQPGGANQLRGNEGVVAAGHVSVNADVAEPLVVHVEDALDVAEPLGLRGGSVHDLNQLGLLDTRGVELELAGLLAQLRDLHRGELLAREGGLGRGEPVVALLAVLLLALTALTARIRLGGGLIAAVGALGAVAVAAGLMTATGLLAPRLRGIGGVGSAGDGTLGISGGRGLLRRLPGTGPAARANAALGVSGGLGAGGRTRLDGFCGDDRGLMLGCIRISARGLRSLLGRIPPLGLIGGALRLLALFHQGGLLGHERGSGGLLGLYVRLGLPAAAVRAQRRVDQRGRGLIGRHGCGGAAISGRCARGGLGSRGVLGREHLGGAGGGAALAANDRGLAHLGEGAGLHDLRGRGGIVGNIGLDLLDGGLGLTRPAARSGRRGFRGRCGHLMRAHGRRRLPVPSLLPGGLSVLGLYCRELGLLRRGLGGFIRRGRLGLAGATAGLGLLLGLACRRDLGIHFF